MGDIKKGVPRGKCRRELKKNGFEACVELKRNMSAQEVKNVILRAFDTEAKVTDYQVLSSSQDAKLCVAEHQHPNGEDIIEKTSLKKIATVHMQKGAGKCTLLSNTLLSLNVLFIFLRLTTAFRKFTKEPMLFLRL